MVPKLSICIPTWNMGNFLKILLDSIFQQDFAYQEVEVCISDNASEDGTTALVKSYQERHLNIIYFRWDQNMGFDRNLLKAVEMAHGEYCWLMGADDVIVSGAVEKILNYLIIAKHDVFLFERIDCDFNMRRLKIRKWFPKVFCNQLFNLSDENDFIEYSFNADSIGAFFSYIGSIVFNRKKWIAIPYNPILMGSGYIHVYYLLKFLVFNASQLFYIAEPVVLCRLVDIDSLREGDMAKRALLDLAGYEQIARAVFSFEPIKYRCLLWVLEKEMSHNMIFQSVLNQRFFSKESTFDLLQIYCKNLYGDKFDIKFLVCDWLYAFSSLRPWIRKLIIFLSFISPKKITRFLFCEKK